MTTATTTTVIDHSSDAGYRTWAAEVIAQILAVGITQTADTGQINTTTVTRPAVNTSGGYVIMRFNDTAHATSPVFFKLEFGTGSSAANPMMWITVGTGSNGTGTINGLVMARVAVATGSAPTSAAVPYISRFCYSATMGVVWMAWKYNGNGTVNTTAGGFVIYRSCNSSGVVTTESVHLLTNSSTVTGSTSNSGNIQVISYLTNLAYSTSPWPNERWMMHAFNLSVTLYSGSAQVFPAFQYTPVVGISPVIGCALINEIGIGSTTVMALVASTTHTFIQAGGGGHGGTSIGPNTTSVTVIGELLLWE